MIAFFSNLYKNNPIQFFMMIAIIYLLLKQSNVIESFKPSNVDGTIDVTAISNVSQLAQKINKALDIDTAGNVTFKQNVKNKKNIIVDGRVGIGVSNPSAKLEVKNITGNCLNLIGAGSGRAQLGFYDDDRAYKGGVQAVKNGPLAISSGTNTSMTISSGTGTTHFHGNGTTISTSGNITSHGKKVIKMDDNIRLFNKEARVWSAVAESGRHQNNAPISGWISQYGNQSVWIIK